MDSQPDRETCTVHRWHSLKSASAMSAETRREDEWSTGGEDYFLEQTIAIEIRLDFIIILPIVLISILEIGVNVKGEYR